MKKAVLTLGLFSMMMLLTSFTITSENIESQLTFSQTSTDHAGGGMYIPGPRKKKDDFYGNKNTQDVTLEVTSQSSSMYYTNDLKKVD